MLRKVAVRPEARRRGHAGAVMGALEQLGPRAYDVLALSTSEAGAPFHAARGWMPWEGPPSVLTPDGVRRTPEDDDAVRALPLRSVGRWAMHPVLRQVVLDTTSPRVLAEFYRELLGLQYRPGDAPPPPGEPDPLGADWLVLRTAGGASCLAFQQVDVLPEATWPHGEHPQMLHLDLTVPTVQELQRQHERALALGARLLLDRSSDEEEPLRVYADPSGHPFCIFVADG